MSLCEILYNIAQIKVFSLNMQQKDKMRIRKSNLSIGIILIIFSFFLIYKFFFYDNKIKIGFVGGLTGKYSVLSKSMINGLQLAFEEVNYKVAGRTIDLVYADDKQNETRNRQIIDAFLQEDRKIIIGNITSEMSKITLSMIEAVPDAFMISAASASNAFSLKNDQFFRVHVPNNMKRFDGFTQNIKKSGVQKIYSIYDPLNQTYSKDYLENFEKSFVKNGGEAFVRFSKSTMDLDALSEDIRQSQADLILICANSVEAAKIVQYLRLKNIRTQIAASEWAMTERFIENGGRAVEGVLFNIDFDEYSQSVLYEAFVNKYQAKYHDVPSIFAMKAYEIGKILIASLKRGPEKEIKKNILTQKIFKGLQGDIIFDKYGDVSREYYFIRIKNGKYKRESL